MGIPDQIRAYRKCNMLISIQGSHNMYAMFAMRPHSVFASIMIGRDHFLFHLSNIREMDTYEIGSGVHFSWTTHGLNYAAPWHSIVDAISIAAFYSADGSLEDAYVAAAKARADALENPPP